MLRINSDADLQYHPMLGGVFESFVFSELYKNLIYSNNETVLYFWQDRANNEIDFLIDNANNPLPIEAKAGQTIRGDFFKNLK